MSVHPVTRLRLERGWTQTTLAVEAGLDISTVSRVERGYHKATRSTITCLAYAFGMTRGEIEELLRG